MLTDLWPLGFMLGLFALLYLISLILKAVGIRVTMSRRPGIPFCPPETASPTVSAKWKPLGSQHIVDDMTLEPERSRNGNFVFLRQPKTHRMGTVSLSTRQPLKR